MKCSADPNPLYEVYEIESKVGACIAELQNGFTEKILDQDKETEMLLSTDVGNTENVQQDSEQIHQAI